MCAQGGEGVMKGIANPHFEAGGLQIRQNKNKPCRDVDLSRLRNRRFIASRKPNITKEAPSNARSFFFRCDVEGISP
jgi:hypothetical protein